MKQLVLFSAFALTALFAAAQPASFQWQPVRHRANGRLKAELKNWEVFAAPIQSMQQTAARHSQGLDMEWRLGERKVSLHLFADDIRGKDYRLTEAGQEGVRHWPAGHNITYGGRVLDGGGLRLTLDSDFLFGYWTEADGKNWFVQPLRDFDPDAPAHWVVVYETAAVKPVPQARCGWTHTEHAKQRMHQEQGAPKSVLLGQCYETEIAIASDFLMFQAYGSVSAVQNFTLGVLNAVQTNFDNEFADEIRFVVVANFVSSCATCDPWTSSTSANSLLVSFRDWGNAGGFGVTYDVASLWTNRDFNGDVIGLAWLGSLCSGNRYNVLQRFTTNANLLRNLQAHELGHNFDAEHDAAGSPFIMAPAVNGSATWSAFSVNTINTYVNLVAPTCFTSCSSGGPQAPTAQIQLPVTHVCPGSVVPIIDASTGNPTSWVWSLVGATPNFSTQQNPVVVYNDVGTFPVQLTVSNIFGSDTQFSSQDIVVSNQGQKFLLYETFENDLGAWQVVNPDNNITWQVKEVGGSPYGKKAAWVNHFNYSGSGQVDGLMSPTFSLANVSNPMLRIDYAYRRRNSSSSEQLRVKISTNGGATFPNTLFTGQENGSGNFATGGFITSSFTPVSASDWCYTNNPGSATCLEINLSAYVGQSNVRILIESVNAGNNNLYVDNVRLQVDCVPSLPPVAVIGAVPTTGCAPLTVTFQDNSTGTVDYRVWNFPGGNPSTSDAAFPVVTYTQPGSYSVALEVFNGAGSSLSVQPGFIQVNSPPVADFSFTVNGNTVQFNNTTQGSASYLWNFGNGQTSIQANPSYTYPQPGTYTVRLTASNDCGQSIKERVVTIAPPLVAGFSATPLSGCKPLTVQFTNTSSGNPTSYQWSFPGGIPATATTPNPSVTYQNAGVYNVQLIVRSGSFADTLTRNQYIQVGQRPAAGFTVNYAPGQTSATFQNASVGADSIRWHVAGQTSTADTATFQFPTDGVYDALLVAYNACGSDTTAQQITVVTAPQAGFNFNAGNGCAPAQVQFVATASANTTGYQWMFPGGNPASSTQVNPLVEYAQPGVYTATLVVSNAAGTDTLAQTVHIGTVPTADFQYAYALGQTSATFQNASVGADSIRWHVAGQTSTADTATFQFPTDGVYDALLVAYNACGSDTTAQQITVVTAPQAGFNFNAGNGCAPAQVQFVASASANTTGYQWMFPGGNPASSTQVNPLVEYAQPGVYTATLVVSNAAGTDTLAQTVHIGTVPTADFQYAYALGQTSATFQNASVGADSIRWHVAGQTSTADTATFQFPTDGVYDALLVAYNACGSDTTTQQITVVTAPQAGFNFNAGNGCAPAQVQFVATASANTTGYQWMFPGGNPASSTQVNPLVEYAQPGVYTATLVVSNAAGTDTLAQTVHIGTVPTADFQYAYALGQTSATFQNASVGADSIRWHVAGQSSTADTATFQFPTDGVYDALLVAYNACGSDTTAQQITVVTAPQAGFNFNAGNGCAPAQVQFVATASANTTGYQWMLPGGNPASSTQVNPLVEYAQPGVYTATLVVSNAAGTDTLAQTVHIGTVPTADFQYAYAPGQTSATFQNASVGADSIRWHVAGQTSTADTATFQFPTDGVYDALLVAYNACGSDTTAQQITVVTAPQAGFNFNAGNGCAPAQVQFVATASANTTGYQWMLPGGNPASSVVPDPLVEYAQPGVYTATLVVSNAAGTDTLSRVLVIGGVPVAAVTFAVNGREVNFQANALGASSFSWNFGDGQTSNLPNPTHTYTSDGTYQATLTVGNACGTKDTTITIVINAALPTANFQANVREGCAPLQVQFVNQSSDNAQTFLWLFPGGTPASSTEVNPVVTYAQPGLYTVTLTAGNVNGNASISRMDYIHVRAAPQAGFGFTVSERTASFVNTSLRASAFTWFFGDGNSSNQPNPTHEYAQAGTYEVVLIAIGDCGADTLQRTVQIIGQAPTALLNASAEGGCAPLTVTFTDVSIGPVTSREWFFPGGNPTSSSEANPVVVYAEAGTFPVTLVVRNAFGADTSDVLPITVRGLPAGGFDFAADGAVVTFQPLTANTSGTSFLWDFGDGATSTNYTPQHTYAGNGVYVVTLTVANACGSVQSSRAVEIMVSSVHGILPKEVAMILYPNPASGLARLWGYNANLVGDVRPLELIGRDALGRVVLQQRLEVRAGYLNCDVQVGNWPSGVYFFELRKGVESIWQGKLVVAH